MFQCILYNIHFMISFWDKSIFDDKFGKHNYRTKALCWMMF